NAGRTTFGHRFLSPNKIEIPSADDYEKLMYQASVVVDPEKRRSEQHHVLEEAASSAGGTLVQNLSLEDEVLGLVEKPFAVVGKFDQSYLQLPELLIETVMEHHQRYFAARDKNGKLLPVFITTVNTALEPSLIRTGNERVMRARLDDAR